MCDYCVDHGAGKKWYLEARNYLKNHAKEEKRQKFISDFASHFMDKYDYFLKHGKIKRMVDYDDPNFLIRAFYSWYFKNKHSGQVIPPEEAELIMELAGQISLVPCVCRMANKGVKENLCMLFFHIPEDEWKTRHFDRQKDIVPLEIAEAQQTIRDFSKQGLVQTVWTFNSPHIGAVCNCDYPYCTAVRVRKDTGIIRSLFKSEYVAEVDNHTCTNCRKCIAKCQFGALTYSASTQEMHIDQTACFGCGLCRIPCNRNAIKLVPRAEVEKVANMW